MLIRKYVFCRIQVRHVLVLKLLHSCFCETIAIIVLFYFFLGILSNQTDILLRICILADKTQLFNQFIFVIEKLAPTCLQYFISTLGQPNYTRYSRYLRIRFERFTLAQLIGDGHYHIFAVRRCRAAGR